MNKYEPGLYQILLFDRYGSKVDTMIASGVIQAQRIGEDILEEEPCLINSFTVMHVLYNSLNPRNNWARRQK